MCVMLAAAIEQGTAGGSRPHGQPHKPVFTSNTQVVLSFDSGKAAEGGSSATTATAAAGRAVASNGTAAAGGGNAAGAGSSKPLPPFLQSALASNNSSKAVGMGVFHHCLVVGGFVFGYK